MAAADLAGLPEAPTFCPSAAEWAEDPLHYIDRVVRPAAERAGGVARIIPPPGWQPPFALDRAGLRVPARRQAVHQLQQRESSAAAAAWWEDYSAYQRAAGGRPKKNPTFGGQEVDLYRLSRLVDKRGGYQAVTDERGWREVASHLQVGPWWRRQASCMAPLRRPRPPRAPPGRRRWARGAATCPTRCASSTPSCCCPSKRSAGGGARAVLACWVSPHPAVAGAGRGG